MKSFEGSIRRSCEFQHFVDIRARSDSHDAAQSYWHQTGPGRRMQLSRCGFSRLSRQVQSWAPVRCAARRVTRISVRAPWLERCSIGRKRGWSKSEGWSVQSTADWDRRIARVAPDALLEAARSENLSRAPVIASQVVVAHLARLHHVRARAGLHARRSAPWRTRRVQRQDQHHVVGRMTCQLVTLVSPLSILLFVHVISNRSKLAQQVLYERADAPACCIRNYRRPPQVMSQCLDVIASRLPSSTVDLVRNVRFPRCVRNNRGGLASPCASSTRRPLRISDLAPRSFRATQCCPTATASAVKRVYLSRR